jgi:hypothetical protein
MTETQQQYTQEQLTSWVREQFQRANKHLATDGILFEKVIQEECRYLAPIVAIWKIKDQQQRLIWVISGEVPVDYVAADNATSAREVMRHFSFSWQIKAENILRTGTEDKTQRDYAALLQKKAELLYQLFNDEKLWVGQV